MDENGNADMDIKMWKISRRLTSLFPAFLMQTFKHAYMSESLFPFSTDVFMTYTFLCVASHFLGTSSRTIAILPPQASSRNGRIEGKICRFCEEHFKAFLLFCFKITEPMSRKFLLLYLYKWWNSVLKFCTTVQLETCGLPRLISFVCVTVLKKELSNGSACFKRTKKT